MSGVSVSSAHTCCRHESLRRVWHLYLALPPCVCVCVCVCVSVCLSARVYVRLAEPPTSPQVPGADCVAVTAFQTLLMERFKV